MSASTAQAMFLEEAQKHQDRRGMPEHDWGWLGYVLVCRCSVERYADEPSSQICTSPWAGDGPLLGWVSSEYCNPREQAISASICQRKAKARLS